MAMEELRFVKTIAIPNMTLEIGGAMIKTNKGKAWKLSWKFVKCERQKGHVSYLRRNKPLFELQIITQKNEKMCQNHTMLDLIKTPAIKLEMRCSAKLI